MTYLAISSMADVIGVDTDVLVYSLFENSEQHSAAKHLLDRAQHGEFILGFSPLVLAEVYAVITDSRRVTSPFTAAEAVKAIDSFLKMPGTILLPIPLELVPNWIDVLQRHSLTSGQAFDAQLVVTLFNNGVQSIYTFDGAAYEQFEMVAPLIP